MGGVARYSRAVRWSAAAMGGAAEDNVLGGLHFVPNQHRKVVACGV